MPVTPYVTVGDVQARMPQLTLNATSKPTSDMVTTFITLIEADVNATLSSLGYVVPLEDDPDVSGSGLGLEQVKTIVIDGVIARTLFARMAAVGGEPTSADRHQSLYDKAIARLTDRRSPMVLQGVKRVHAAPEQKMAGWNRGFGFVPQSADVTTADDDASVARVTMANRMHTQPASCDE